MSCMVMAVQERHTHGWVKLGPGAAAHQGISVLLAGLAKLISPARS